MGVFCSGTLDTFTDWIIELTTLNASEIGRVLPRTSVTSNVNKRKARRNILLSKISLLTPNVSSGAFGVGFYSVYLFNVTLL